ncbi:MULTISPECIES: hypothetical protein [Corynebacterium]|uniref:Secreted protein n=1 Tax=Corynebacterium amycolatum TaxID=43765 RepID=A0AB38XWI9_CORAY|nr:MULTISPECIES: hypothetical protein [Corynebacterium]AIN82584.1 hypothetical protein DR71_1188 [Corynebacterium sp. ATCC 6931]MBC6726004.1 hypothetical protein [Corynebacterium amycolatum]MDK8819976.1 hypothetical protein [Corynebacterium amycolatum]OFM84078.1 hypothetical protein HMPREF2651_08355 [Corynebacterium sp. HMSC063A05]OFU57671.1 hypothetical protein HMPREF3122_00760 [Corynebacterium sp. HMSC11H10]
MATNRSNHSDDSFGEWSINPDASDDQPSADTPANAWSAVDGAQWEQAEGQTQYLQQYQQSQQPEPYRPAPYVPGPQAGPAAAPSNDNKGLTIAVIVLALVAVSLLAGAMAFFYFSDSKGVNSAGSNSSQSVQSARTEDSSTSSTAEKKRRAEGFQPPSSWRHCSGSGDSGDLNLVYAENVGGNTTTCPFATNVRNSFVEQYQLTKKLNGTVTASSPTTGKTYTMTCRDNGEVVTCTGGTNATVHIV